MIKSLRSQRGALIFLAPMVVSAIVLMMVLAVDGARLLALQSEMQNQVNAAASAAADGAQACGGADIEMATMSARALAAAKAAGFDGADDALSVIPGLLESTEESTDIVFRRVPESALSRSNGVRVSMTREEPISKLFPGGLFGTVTLEKSAAVRKEVNATISAVGESAGIDEGLLGDLIGAVLGDSSYSLNSATLSSIEGTLIKVGDLSNEMGVASAADLVDEPLIDLLTAVTSLVGGSSQPVGEVVDDLTKAAGVTGLSVSNVLKVVEGASVPPDASFPVYDLVISTVMNSARVLSGDGSLLELDLDMSESTLLQSLSSTVDELSSLDVDIGLHVAEAPKIVYGPARQDSGGEWLTQFQSAAIRLEAVISAGLSLGEINSLISTLSIGLIDLKLLEDIEIPVAIQAGGGRGSFVSGHCARGGNDNDVSLGFDLVDTVVDVETGRIDPGSGVVIPENVYAEILEITIDPPLLPPYSEELCVDAGLVVDLYGESTLPTVIDNYPLECVDGDCARQGLASGNSSDDFSADVNIISPLDLACGNGGLGAGVLSIASELVNPITILLEDVTSEVVRSVLAPLLTTLGVNPGGMSVTVLNANQNTTQLVENVSIVGE